MESIFQGKAEMTGRLYLIRYSRGLVGGLIGGLAGTLVMDLVLMGALSALGLPALTCFSIVGNTVARFFSIQGVEVERAIQLGVITHYLIGPLVGLIYGVGVVWIKALHVISWKKSILFAILYVEILSQPLLATTPILLKMTVPVTLQWYAGSFVMHLLFAVVLGAVVFRIIHTKNPVTLR
ncbi:MAG: hypothetical protein WCI88_04455 [Chloroflexota bacterium]